MKKTLTISFLLASIFTLIIGFTNSVKEKPKISFTFDDGSTRDYVNYKLKDWNQLILDNIQKHNIKAVFFATGSRLTDEKGKEILASWDRAGHKIGNHTYSHPNFNNGDVTAQMFEREIIINDSIIKNYINYFPYFRFPYLKEGNTVAKRDSIRKYLTETGYKNGYVTIDASDWCINSRLSKKLYNDSSLNLKPYKDFYIQHLFERACFYESLAYKLTNRHIHHTLLLHHNLTSALFLDDLIQHFEDKGWEIVDADKAFKDKIYNKMPNIIPAGESLIWALAKESGHFDSILRYPAEDDRYEKDKMDNLGL
jgi:peptidoglycan/xylan/chitin deacetylase (PgdA/CDA1 family)